MANKCSAPGEGRACEVLHNLDRWWRRANAENHFSRPAHFAAVLPG